MDIKSLEIELLKLSPKEKARLSYILLESIEDDKSGELEKIWIEEAVQRYYDAKLHPGSFINSELVLKEAKAKYK